MRRALVGVAVGLASLAVSAPADAARYAVGLAPGADAEAVARSVERRSGSRPEQLAPIPALVVELSSPAVLSGIRGVRYVEPLVTRRLAMTPTDPLVSKQWYLTQSRFYEPWITLPALERIPVAVIDSGVDAGHPELAGKIIGSKSFVGGIGGHGHVRARDIRGRPDRRGRRKRDRNRRARPVRRAPRRQGRDEVAVDLRGGGGARHSLGGRERRARDQHEPGRRTGPARSEPRHLLAARGGRGGVRGLERRRRGCRRGERRPGAHRARGATRATRRPSLTSSA